ncbi:hypothetical protein [Bradyrhizobium sp. CCGUVB23]|uniref:hypothetical protein n=1 Tax=Bradyrhizobium sp. CCGUVB23 TaxID=2949630 RepID=UPI0020B2CAAF|nr:hypothetical protein [Bradyrhizobium sp. CCGUVB23]MCP3461087.1 hypothetical protein [Bradyrhizobium sp. CCGUVB23]
MALILGPARSLTPSTRKGSAYAEACRRFAFVYAVIAAPAGHIGRLSRGDGPRHRTGTGSMSQSLAFANGWNLAITLMVCVIIFQAGTGEYGVMPASEYDGDPAAVIHEFDPFQR